MQKKLNLFFMSMLLIVQLISNGLFIPMTASATDNVTTEQTPEQQAEAEQAAKEAQQQAYDKARAVVNEFFTDDTKTEIANTVNVYTFNAMPAYLEDLTDEDKKAELQQDIDLAEVFVSVNQLFTDEHIIVKGLEQATIDAANAQLQALQNASAESKKALADKIATATKQVAAAQKKAEADAVAQQKAEAKADVKDREKKEATNEAAVKKVEKAAAKVVEKKSVKAKSVTEYDLKDYTTKVYVADPKQPDEIPDNYVIPDDYKFKIKDFFKLRLDFSFEDKLNAGDVLKYELPKGTYAKAEDIDSDNSSLGDGITGKLVYDSTNNILKITLLNDVEAQSSGGVFFKSWFAETISETPYTLKYPIKESAIKEIKIDFVTNTPVLTMKKEAKGNKQYNTDKVEYTITFQGAHEGNTVVDELPSGLTKESFTIDKYAYNAITGKFSDTSTDDTQNWKDSGSSTGKYELKRTGDTGGIGDDKYVIKLSTKVPDSLVYGDGIITSGTVETNTAKIVKGDSSSESIKGATSGTVTIDYPKPYEKRVAGYDVATQTITWQIYYNVNQKNLLEQTIIDTFNDGFTFNDLKVYKANVKVNEITGKLEISKLNNTPVDGIVTLPSQTTQKTVGIVGNTKQQVELKVVPTSKPYIFEYTTVANDVVTGGQITNTAKILGVWEPKNGVSQNLTNTAGNKSKGPNEINYVNKTADWEITLNTAMNAGNLTGVEIIDVYGHSGSMGMTTNPTEVVVKVKGNTQTLADFDPGAIITLTKDDKGKEIGFTIDFSSSTAIEPNTKILYTTSYDLKGVGNNLKNTASIDYTSNGTSKTGISIGSPSYGLKTEANSDGNKAGVYNPETKEITWTVNVNYYGATIKDATFIDTIEGNQTYVKGSLAVYQARVDKTTGDISRNNEDDNSNWGVNEQPLDSATFTINKSGEINTPYQIVYKTKVNSGVVDDELQLIIPKEEYKNTATFNGTGITETKFENITPSGLENGGEIITKTHDGKDKGSKTKHKWTIDINKSQSKIDNTIVEDTLKGDMELITDSFKLTKTEYNGATATDSPQSIEVKEFGTDVTTIKTPTIIFNEDGKGFKLYLGNIDRGYKLTYLTNYTGDPKATDNLPSNAANIKGEALVTGDSSKSGKTLTATEVGYSTALAWINYKPKLAIHKIAVQKDAISEVKVADLEGVEFILYDEDNKEIASGTTQKDGKLTFDKTLSSGYYYLAEKKVSPEYKKFGQDYAGDGYKTDFVSNGDKNTLLTKTINGHDAIRVEISGKTVTEGIQQVELTVKNYLTTPTGCQQTFINKDGDTALPGSEYKVTDKAGIEIVRNIKADSQGNIITPTLPKGEYILVQTKEPTGYDSLAKNTEFSVHSSDCNVSPIIVKNNHACESFVVTFENAEDFPVYVSGSEFKLVDEQDKTVKSTDGTEFNDLKLVDGQLILANVPNGSYKLVQTKVPTGYKNINDISVSVNGTTCDEEFKVKIPTGADTLACPQFDITVQDSDKQAITTNDDYKKFVANAKFELVDAAGDVVKSGDKELTALKINIDGKVVLGDTVVGSTELKVDAGEYTLKQINQVIGYKQITEKVVANGTDCNAIVTVPTAQGELTACPDYYIQVVDKDGKALTNQTVGYEKYVTEATFKLVGSDNTEILKVKIGADGKLSINHTDLTAPNYKLVQTNSVDGFYKLTADVTPKSDDCYAVVTINNQCSDTQFSVDAIVPAGVTYMIENADKTKSYTLKTVEENNIIVLKQVDPANSANLIDLPKALSVGEYTIKTIDVPAGYAKSSEQKVTVTDNNEENCLVPVTLTVVDCPDFTVNYQGPANSTAEFKLEKKDGTVIEEHITVSTDASGKGTLNFTQDAAKALQAGDYRLVQTKQPSGYYSASAKEFTVNAGECAAELTVTNNKIPPELCKKPVISVTPITGEKPEAGTKVTVTTENGQNSEGTVDSKGTVTFEEGKAPTLVPGKTVKVKVKGFKEQTTKLNEINCSNTVYITPIKACEKVPVITIDPSVKPTPGTEVKVTPENGTPTTGKVSEDGTTVEFEPGKEPKLTPEETVTITIEGYDPVTEVVPEDCKEITITPEPTDPSCEKVPVITIDPSVQPTPGTEVTVTPENGTPTTGKVSEDGTTIEFEPGKEPTLEPGKKVTVKVDGYEETTVTVDEDCTPVITITPEQKTCAEFAVIVKDQNGEPLAGALVKADGTTISGTTNSEGKIILTNKDFAIAQDSVLLVSKDGYAPVQVKVSDYDQAQCQAIVQLQAAVQACPEFTVNVTGKNDPIIGATVTVKGDETVTGTVNEQGEVVYDGNKPQFTPGTMIEITKDGFEKQTIVISEGTATCEIDVTLTELPKACPQFTVTVNDETGAVAGANVLVKGTTAVGVTAADGTIIFMNNDITENSIVVVTKEGYATKEVTANELCEVVVTITSSTTTPPVEEPGETPETPVTPPTTPPVIVPPTPGNPTDPGANPENPTDPGTNPENPTDPGTNPENPTDPGTNPENPTDPGTNPENPTDPGTNPENPTDPGTNPENPTDPGTNPENPTDPGTNPENPTDTEDPDVDEEPNTPTSDREDPVTPSTPSTPTTPNTPPKVPGTMTPDGKVNIPVNAVPGKYYDLYDDKGNLIARNIKANPDGSITLDEALASGNYTLKPSNGQGESLTFSYTGTKNNNASAGNTTNNGNTSGNNATNGTTGNKATSKGSSLLPQTGEQVALYSLVGMLLIGAAFMLFKRNRRKA